MNTTEILYYGDNNISIDRKYSYKNEYAYVSRKHCKYIITLYHLIRESLSKIL